MILPKLSVLLLIACGCGNIGSDTCAKAKECCGKVDGACDSINKEGEGFEDRCAIQYTTSLNILSTYDHDACDDIADAYQEYYSCLADIECKDVSDSGEVATCNQKAVAVCQARKASGDDVCGGDYNHLKCDDDKARFRDMY